MYPDSSHAAFHQHRKAFLRRVKDLLGRRRFRGTGPELDQVFCRVGRIENSFDKRKGNLMNNVSENNKRIVLEAFA